MPYHRRRVCVSSKYERKIKVFLSVKELPDPLFLFTVLLEVRLEKESSLG